MTLLSLLLAVTTMAGNGPTLLTFSGGERSAWQQVTANGQILGSVPSTPLETPAGCYGMGRLFDRTLWIAAEHYFWTIGASGHSGGIVPVETIAGSSGRHLYRIIRGQKVSRKPLEHAAVLEEIDPSGWTLTRSWRLPGTYRSFGCGHLAVDPAEAVAYYATEAASGLVHRHDLRADVVLPELSTRAVGSGGLLVCQNGSVVVGYLDGVRWFAPDGTLQRTCPIGPFRPGQGLIAHGADDRSCWVQGCEDGTPYSTLYEFGIDGSLRHQWNTPANGVRWDAPFVDEQRWHY